MPVQTFAVDLRRKSLGGESLVTPMLYPLMRDKHLVHLKYPEAYAHKEELQRLTVDLHIRLQRSNTQGNNWNLTVLMNQNADADAGWGSLSHQIYALRRQVLSPLEGEFGQQPAFTLGLLFDQWDRTTKRQIPTSQPEFIQWSIDRFGMLCEDLSPTSTISEQPSTEYPHLLTHADLDRLSDDVYKSEIDDLFDQKIQACRSIRQDSEERGDVHPPVQNIDELSATRDEVKSSIGKSGPTNVAEDVRKRLSALGPILHRSRNDFALLRIPIRQNPLSRRRWNLIYRDYILGAIPRLPDDHLENKLARQENKGTRAYWVGTTQAPNQASQIHCEEDDICAAAQESGARLQQARDSLSYKNLGDFKIELLEPFDYSCDLEDSDEWKDTIRSLNNFSYLRTSQPNKWSRWVDAVDETIQRRDAGLSSDLTECLVKARQEWRNQPTRKREGSDIEDVVTELRLAYQEKRDNVFAKSPDGFINDWKERADAHADSVRRAFQIRPTKSLIRWAVGMILFLLLPALITVSSSLSQQLLSIGFWTGSCALILWIGFYLARRRLVSKIRHQTNQAINEARLVIESLQQFVQDRKEIIEQYFEVLAAKRNLERAEQRQRQIELDRLHHRHHWRALREHSENTEALQKFLGCSGSAFSPTDETFPSDVERMDTPPFESSTYTLRGSEDETVEVLGHDEIETDLLPGLRKIGYEPDPAFQVDYASDSACEG